MTKDEPKGLQWRKNIHSTIMLACHKNGLPQVIIDAIDAAYVAGLDATKTEPKELKELMAEFAKYVNELQQEIPPNDKHNSDSPVKEFGYKTRRDNELFTIPDWGNIKNFIVKAFHSGRAAEREKLKKMVEGITTELHMKKWRTPMKANQNIKGFDLMDVYLEQDVNQALSDISLSLERGECQSYVKDGKVIDCVCGECF